MLTIYEQIQLAIDLIEKDLSASVPATVAARSAGMSLRSLHRYFPSLTGYTFGEYARKRRLSEARDRLMANDVSILAIAIESGYDSHEAFTRAFKGEFGVAPSKLRTHGASAPHVGAIDLVGEVMMGVLTKSLSKMNVVVFDGFKPDPEETAIEKMEAWMERHPEVVGSHRTFGHNIDLDGRLAHDPDNVGYRVMVTVADSMLPFEDETRVDTIESGTFVVTGIEGSFHDDPSGSWITEGWQRLQEMVKRNHLEIHQSHRWFEEVLEPTEPGKTRFDLYLELA
ncbi:MAG: helix-turn-helix transcriptional regulator [Acidimicrobiia bacterium]|nr:helix-turn-helix transcriptional regulator [Acidimicrobiia bacterium]